MSCARDRTKRIYRRRLRKGGALRWDSAEREGSGGLGHDGPDSIAGRTGWGTMVEISLVDESTSTWRNWFAS